METFEDLTSKLKNLEYYKNEVIKLLKKQNEYDIAKDNGGKRQINPDVMEVRFKCLGICIADMEWIDSYISNALIYIQKANGLDKRIFQIESEEETNSEITEQQVPVT